MEKGDGFQEVRIKRRCSGSLLKPGQPASHTLLAYIKLLLCNCLSIQATSPASSLVVFDWCGVVTTAHEQRRLTGSSTLLTRSK